MRIFLVEQYQTRPKWGKPIKHVNAASVKEAVRQFDYLRNCVDLGKLRAHELILDDDGDLWGKDNDCPECMEYCQGLWRKKQDRASDLDLCGLDSSNDYLFSPGVTTKAEVVLRDGI